MSTDSGWKRHDYKRQCSICGHLWKKSKLRYIGEGKWACVDDWNGLTATQISRHNARARPLKVLPVRHPKPNAWIDEYQLEEAQIFNLVTSVSPWNTQQDKDNGAAKSTQAAAHAGIYLAELLQEGLRPTRWLTTAQASLVTNLTFLLTQQYGSLTGPAAADHSTILYGGLLDNGAVTTNATALAGVAFIKGYQLLGTIDYLNAAKACAQYLRHQQVAYLSTGNDQTQYNSAVIQVLGVAAGVAGSLITTDYYLADQGAAIWFLTILASVIGIGSTFGEASGSYFTGSTVASLATMIAGIETFIQNGEPDTAFGGQFITGLSATTPRLRYRAQTPANATLGTWVLGGASGNSIVTDEWALCMFGLNYAGALSAQVAAVYNYLMAMTPNPANAQTSHIDAQILANTLGTYVPTIAPAVSVETTGVETTGTYYSWTAAAWLGPIQDAVNPQAFKLSKDTLAIPRRISTMLPNEVYMGPLGRSGLSYQVANLQAQVAVPFP